MFGDMEYTGHSEQEENFSDFIRRGVDLVILIGSSGAVPTNDYTALQLKNNGAKLININPDPSTNDIAQSEIFLTLKSEEALVKLDQVAFGE
jgi:NAD-dependent SIR2 family protein deacetylase